MTPVKTTAPSDTYMAREDDVEICRYASTFAGSRSRRRRKSIDIEAPCAPRNHSTAATWRKTHHMDQPHSGHTGGDSSEGLRTDLRWTSGRRYRKIARNRARGMGSGVMDELPAEVEA